VAPDFSGETTEGRIKFHEWIGNSWAILFSHPEDFTPLCTTKRGYIARLKPEFDKRGCKVNGLSADAVSNHTVCAKDIQETHGQAPNSRTIGDADLTMATLCDVLSASEAPVAVYRNLGTSWQLQASDRVGI
jgi:alkyl hydroperoxide reductase subunit AhpC